MMNGTISVGDKLIWQQTTQSVAKDVVVTDINKDDGETRYLLTPADGGPAMWKSEASIRELCRPAGQGAAVMQSSHR